jgi:phosphatidylglycerophosphate synthase
MPDANAMIDVTREWPFGGMVEMEAETRPQPELSARRPLASRGSKLARSLTSALLKTSITPNQISMLSLVFAVLAGAALWFAPRFPWLYLLAVIGIQLRLLCNLMDGMIAVEGGRHSAVGALYNEFPDRIADSIIIVALGYAAAAPMLGWAGALAAALTAYIRATGGALGLKQDFRGPLAKQQRMALISAGSIAALIEALAYGTLHAVWLTSLFVLISRRAANDRSYPDWRNAVSGWRFCGMDGQRA